MTRPWLRRLPLALLVACTPASDTPGPQAKVETAIPTTAEARSSAAAGPCDGLDHDACVAAPGCSPELAAPFIESDGRWCLAPRQFAACISGDQVCLAAHTVLCREPGQPFLFDDACDPPGWRECEPPVEERDVASCIEPAVASDTAPDPALAASRDADRDFSVAFTLAEGVHVQSTIGPFASVSALCDVLAEDPQPCDAVFHRAAPIPGLTGASELTVLVAGEPGISEVDASLALRTDDGWFVAHRFEHLDHSVHGDTSSTFSIRGAESISIAPGRDAMKLTFATKLRRGRSSSSRAGAIVCAVATSGRPECTTTIPAALDRDLDADQVIALRTTFPGDGTVTIALADPADGPRVLDSAILGIHPLRVSE